MWIACAHRRACDHRPPESLSPELCDRLRVNRALRLPDSPPMEKAHGTYLTRAVRDLDTIC